MTALTSSQLQARGRTWLDTVTQTEADRGAMAARLRGLCSGRLGTSDPLAVRTPVRVSLAQCSHMARRNHNPVEKFRPVYLDGGQLEYLSSAPKSTTLRCGFLQPQRYYRWYYRSSQCGRGRILLCRVELWPNNWIQCWANCQNLTIYNWLFYNILSYIIYIYDLYVIG